MSSPQTNELSHGDPSSATQRRRPLRVLFFVREVPYVQRIYASLIVNLAERGHEIHLAVGERLGPGEVERLTQLMPQVSLSYSLAPRRPRSDGWRSVAWIVRALADLARYAHPRFDGAPRLRWRVAKKVLHRLAKPRKFEPLGRRLALRVARRLASSTDAELSARVIRAAARLEEAIPTSAEIDRYVRELAPDVVLVTPVVKYASEEVEYLKSARRLRIPAASCVASWDNLTNKGLLKFVPERVFVWNEIQRKEAIELHGIPPDHVVATGAQLFDKWFEQQPSRSREEFLREVGLDPAEASVLYVCSSPFVTNKADDEVRFVSGWLEALRASDDERMRRIGVVVRPHPRGKHWRGADLRRFGNVAVWPRRSAPADTPEALADFYDSLVHSAAVVGINTTAMIEAAIVGKSVLTVLAAEFAQESTLHFHYLLEENGGFLHVASSLEEHVAQLARVLDEGGADADRRLRFVESFVRPRGLDRPATPILADAVEELAGLTVHVPARPGTLPLRAALEVEARLCSLAIAAARARRRMRGLRQRLVTRVAA